MLDLRCGQESLRSLMKNEKQINGNKVKTTFKMPKSSAYLETHNFPYFFPLFLRNLPFPIVIKSEISLMVRVICPENSRL